MEGGAVLAALLADVRAESAGEAPLLALADACEAIGERLLQAPPDDRLAASYPFLTMVSVAVSGWLFARQLAALAAHDGDPAFKAMKRTAARFYLDQVVPEALGLAAAASAPADILYALDEEALSA
jgi:hypothetical protein